MTETKNTPTEPIAVDSKKLIDGLGTIFGGVIQLLAATEPSIAKELSDMAINGVKTPPNPAPAETALKDFNPDDFEEILAADDLPWDTEPEQPKQEKKPKKVTEKKEQTTLTADDLIRVVTQKIKKDRSNKEKVLALLKSYGAAKVSDVPADKYEAFLTDLSQL